MSDAMRLKSDTKLRKRWFTPEATALHPAKGNIGLWQTLIDRYTEPGQWVLDPMAGIGTTLVAALMGRNVICLEKEAHFIVPMLASWRKMQMSPLLGYETGQVLILRGLAQHLPLRSHACADARQAGADVILTSPPYTGAWGAEDSTYSATMERERRHRERHPNFYRPPLPGAYTRPDIIVTSPPFEDQLPSGQSDWLDKYRRSDGSKGGFGKSLLGKSYTRPDVIVTSPPYENQVTGDTPGGKLFETERRVNSPASGNRKSKRKGLGFGYTRPDAIITSPPYEGSVGDNKEGPSQTSVPGGWKAGTVNKHGGYTRPDAIIVSPPYEQAQSGGGINATMAGQGGYKVTTNKPGSVYADWTHGDAENIGQMRGERYWAAMKDCYTEWRRCLKPGGLMVLVIKGCTRDGQYVDLPGQTRALCEEIGWTFVETWKRELWSLSFWRILESTDKVETITGHRQDMWGGDLEDVKVMKRVNNGKMDERLRFEEVLVMRNET